MMAMGARPNTNRAGTRLAHAYVAHAEKPIGSDEIWRHATTAHALLPLPGLTRYNAI
jgi:hypothetical protein